MKVTKILASFALVFAAAQSYAATVTFTGGVATLNDGTTQTTNQSATWNNVASYTENGFLFTFSGATTPLSSNVGNYYGAGNDVIHGHWATGNYGGLTRITVTKVDNSAFALSSFLLTSNTDSGGGPASGNERSYIHASIDGATESFAQLLPSENWGFPGTTITVGSAFSNVKSVWFTAENKVDCFGMDDFTLAAAVPEPGSYAMLLVGLGMLGFVARRRKSAE